MKPDVISIALREQAATHGRWVAGRTPEGRPAVYAHHGAGPAMLVAEVSTPEDATFIAAAHVDVAALLEHAAELEELLEEHAREDRW